jgi:NAD dependent epimerase/dehydratase
MINKKVLVTGADGFIGSHLVERLVSSGYEVKALVQYNSFNSWGWLEDTNLINKIDVVEGDIRDSEFCNKICKDTENLIHLAALVSIPYSYVSIQSYLDTNIMGTNNICNAALKNKLKRVLITSTSEVYGTAKYIPIDENHPFQPQSPYSASKIAADSLSLSYYNTFDLPVTIVRPFNTYGPRQSARAIIPTVITQIIKNKGSILLGDTSPTRDLNYVTDTCEGFIRILEKDETIGMTLNLGSGKEISIKNLVEKISIILKKNIKIKTDKKRVRPENSEVYRLLSNSDLFKEITGYKNRKSLDEGLEETIRWFSDEKNLKKYKTNKYNV